MEASLGVEIPAPYVVRIKKGSTEVKKSAFYGCKFISDVIFPEGITTIKEYAFRMCSSLTSITIPERTSRIHFEAFLQTPALSEIHGKREHLERVLPESRRKYIVDAN